MMVRLRHQGMTLIELMVVVAILMLLAGTLYVALAPAREKGRQTVCISNLRQIGMALSMYRAAYDGVDPDGRQMEYWELGLPSSPVIKAQFDPYMKDRRLWVCPNSDCGPTIPGYPDPCDPTFPFIRTYTIFWLNENFKEQVAHYRDEIPVFLDKNHGFIQGQNRYVLILRLNNQVKGKLLPFPEGTFDY